MENRPIMFEISLRTILRVAIVLLTIIFIFAIRDIVVLLLLGIILASGVAHFATALERRGLPRIISILLVYIAAMAVFTAILWFIVPQIMRDLGDFAKGFPEYFGAFAKGLEDFGLLRKEVFLANFQQVLSGAAEAIGAGAGRLSGIIFGIFGGVIAAISVFLISVYLALQKDGIERFLRMFVPNEQEPYIVDLWHRAERKISSWVRGQLLLSLLIGIITWIGLSLFGVKYALLLAVVAAMLEVVPMVGPIAAGILAVGVALLQAPLLALITAAFYLVVQQIEGNVLVPLIFRRTLGLHPVVVILALMIGAKLGGIIGIILAVPLTAVLLELLNDWALGKVKL